MAANIKTGGIVVGWLELTPASRAIGDPSAAPFAIHDPLRSKKWDPETQKLAAAQSLLCA